ncbi:MULTISPECIES: hypothetical protein [Chromobacterium]|uniref:hypothetical protein n=1 Tax=Chromobacterium TaxID=535 RepID=UPI001886CAC1|nr:MULTISPECIES: hypothetical protein [Chromobacterium]WON83877.1 hypothetical protein OK026_22640 [Chromobacterium haemolyticum]
MKKYCFVSKNTTTYINKLVFIAMEITCGALMLPVEASDLKHIDWAGKWLGVEGMYLNITPSNDHYQLEMQFDLDSMVYRGAGLDDQKGIVFIRDNNKYILRAGPGNQSGLKGLNSLRDCLIVVSGEAYCRDK